MKCKLLPKQQIYNNKEAVTRLKVTVKIAPLVHVSKALKYLKAPITDFNLRKHLASIFHKLVKIAFLNN